jgi:membrane dipeptidase
MERVGMVLCLSHAGERTVRDALDYVTVPPIFSHSNPAGRAAHVRNISDDLMRRCAAKGGVIGLSGIGPFLGATDGLVGQLLDQLRYVIDLVGPAHVGLGLDYVFDTAELEAHVRANPSGYPQGVDGGLAMVGPEALVEIASGLARDNLADAQIRMVLGGNWLRIARQVWK